MVNLILAAALTARLAAAQTAPAATVSGTVTDAVTRLPVEGAIVTAGTAVMRTDSLGAYKLRVPAGNRRIAAFRTGYLKLAPASETEVHEGENIRKDFELRPAPRISGTLMDADTGQRLRGCIVFALRRIMSVGEAWYTAAGIPTANGRDGTFEIMGLDPGSYVLEVTGCQWSFYPGVDRIEMATPLALTEAGVAGLNIKLRAHSGHKVSGTVEGGAVDLQLVRVLQGEAQVLAQLRSKASGEFEFDNVPEGEYCLAASDHATTAIDITDRDLTGLALKLYPPGAVELSLKMRDDGAPAPSKLRLSLAPAIPGNATLRWPRVTGLPEGYAVAAVLGNELPLPNGSVPIDGLSHVTFVITNHTAGIEGKVQGAPALVFAIREPFTEYLDVDSLPRSGTDESGAYSIENLAPGDYKLVVLTGEEELLRRNEKFLRRKAESAESVEIPPDGTTLVDLK